jgi:hypothetical protein
MNVAATFGSIGDFIAICQLAYQLTQILGLEQEGSSSSAEYQQLRNDLDTFLQVLTQVNSP